MTSKISLVSIAKQKLSQNIWLLAASFLTLFFTSPLIIFMETTNNNWLDDYTSMEYYSKHLCDLLINNFATCMITICAAYIIPLVLFKYINSKPEVDFYHSLPIKREKFFITNYILGLLIFIIPYLLTTMLSLAIITLNCPFYSTFTQEFINSTSTILLVFVATYSINVFATVITGNIFMAVATGLGFMFLFSAVGSISLETLNILLDNFYLDYTTTENLFINTTPMYHLLDTYSMENSKNLTSCVIIALVYTSIAYFLYKNRRSENAGNPVAINFLKPVIKFLGVFGATLLGGFLFCSITSQSVLWFIFGGLLIGFIIHCSFEIIYESDFKALFKNFKYFIVYAVAVTLVFTIVSFDVFGFDNKLPDLSKIESVELTRGSYAYPNDIIKLHEKENIETVYKLASLCIDSDKTSSTYNRFYVKFYLENGQTMTRQYKDVLIEFLDTELYYDLLLSDEYLDEVIYEEQVNLDELTSLEYDYYTFTEQESAEIYQIFLQENQNIPNEYYRYNAPISCFYTNGESEDSYSYVKQDIYEIHQNTIAKLCELTGEDNLMYIGSDFYEMRISVYNSDGEYQNYDSEDTVEISEIFEDVIFVDTYYRVTNSVLTSSSEVIYVQFYSYGDTTYGYIKPEQTAKYLDLFDM